MRHQHLNREPWNSKVLSGSLGREYYLVSSQYLRNLYMVLFLKS